MLCQECHKKPFCSHPCPEAELFASQDNIPRREFFHFSEPRYMKPLGRAGDMPRLSKKEWKIVTLEKKGLSREEICKILEISRLNLSVSLSRLRSKCNAFTPLFD